MPESRWPSARLDLGFARSQFPALSSDWAFMDNAGGSQVLAVVVDRIREYLTTSNVQLGASYGVSVLAARRQREAQASVAEWLNAHDPCEVVMGPSSTMLLQTLARGLAPSLGPGDEIVVTRVDHESNIGPWMALESRGVTVKVWEFDRERYVLDLERLERLMTPRTRLVAVTHASNILGAIVPVAEIARRVHQRGAQICVDGVAYAPHRAIDVRAWNVDYYVCSFYKVFGPHHAVLYGRRDRLLALANQYHYFIPEDRIPYKLQPGNPNYELSYGAAGIADYLVALGERAGAAPGDSRRARIEAAYAGIARHEAALAARLLEFLASRQAVRLLGPPTADPAVRVPTISFVVRGVTPDTIVGATDRRRIGIRHGDFHARRLVEALDLDPASGVVRVSLVHYNSIREVDRLIDVLSGVLPASR
ncbi:MAG: cysteine desulfurase-like protein [Vicinamibacterales bacterium]